MQCFSQTRVRHLSSTIHETSFPFYRRWIAPAASPKQRVSLISFLHAFLIDSIDWFEYVRRRGGDGRNDGGILWYGCVMMKTTCDFYKSQTMTKERTKLKRVEGKAEFRNKTNKYKQRK